jgi:hypothetical protein
MSTRKLNLLTELYSTSYQALSQQIIILRVAMGHGLLKETIQEVSTSSALVFAQPATVDAKSQMAVQKSEGSIYGPRTPAVGSGTSINEHGSTVGTEC